ncbi:MAG: DUF6089 family protein [Saprospiraceae bacterium]|nr:DUF6089 family protein [Saprospiraceae bacterium]
MNKIPLLLLFLCAVLTAPAQDTEIGISGGIATYSGDLSPSEFGIFLEEMGPAFGAFSRFNVSKWISFRLGLNYASVSGDESLKNPTRGLSFRSSIVEGGLQAELNFLRFGDPNYFLTALYLTGGLNVFYFNPQGPKEDEWIDLQPLGTEGQGLQGNGSPYSRLQFNLPFGGGIKFVFNDLFTIGTEFAFRKLFTDYLDDISGREVDYQEVLQGNGPMAAFFSNPTINDTDADLTYRRGGQFDDWLFMGLVTLSYRIVGKESVFKTGWTREGIYCPRF